MFKTSPKPFFWDILCPRIIKRNKWVGYSANLITHWSFCELKILACCIIPGKPKGIWKRGFSKTLANPLTESFGKKRIRSPLWMSASSKPFSYSTNKLRKGIGMLGDPTPWTTWPIVAEVFKRPLKTLTASITKGHFTHRWESGAKL